MKCFITFGPGLCYSLFVFATKILQFLYFINPEFQDPIAILFDCTARFVLDLVGNLENRFSHDVTFTELHHGVYDLATR